MIANLCFGWLDVEVRLVGFLVIEPVSASLDVHLLCIIVVEVTVTQLTFVRGMWYLGVALHRHHKLLTWVHREENSVRLMAHPQINLQVVVCCPTIHTPTYLS